MRALQYEGRIVELVAFAIGAKHCPPTPSHAALKTSRDPEMAQRTMDRLAREFRKKPEISDLARELGTNSNKLRAVFKAVYGTTMAEYCLDRRMREAQQLLLQPNLSISQIAERVGYQYPSGFAAAFSSHVGMTPREYRKHRAAIGMRRSPPMTTEPRGRTTEADA
jgi:AraC-like DNA-binding protein